MEYIFEECELQLERLENEFETQLDLASFYQESNVLVKTKDVVVGAIDKIIGIFVSYIRSFKQCSVIIKHKKEIEKVLWKCKKAIQIIPKIGKKIIHYRAYGIDPKTYDSNLDVTYKLSKNIGNKVLMYANNDPMDEIFDRYQMYKAGGDDYYQMTINDAIRFFEVTIAQLETLEHHFLKQLTDFKFHVQHSHDATLQLIDDFKTTVKHMQMRLKGIHHIATINLQRILFEIHHDTKTEIEETAKKLRKEPSLFDQRNNATYVGEFRTNGVIFHIYELKEDHTSCFNYMGRDIYMDSSIWKLPKAYMEAILLHEIGHYMNGHFHPINGIEDEAKQVKQLRKDQKKFNKLTYNSLWDSKDLENGNELIYILVELEADRFAAKFVGKKSVQNALEYRFDKSLRSQGLSQDAIDYNNYRMKLRTSML